MQALAVLCLLAADRLSAENTLVLPFFNLSSDGSLDWIGESLSETLRDALASEGLLVLQRQDREEAFRRLAIRQNSQLTRATVIRLGEVLDADQVIFGSFQFTPPEGGQPKIRGSLRIHAQSIHLRRASRGPDQVETGSLEDLARLQTRLAWQTVRVLVPRYTTTEEEFRSRRPAVRVDAIENYTRGLLAASPEQSLKYLLQAVRLDSRFSQASFQLGKAWWERQSWRLASEQFTKVASWDASYREALFFLGLCRYHMKEFAGAQDAFRRVAEQVPLNEVWNNLGAAQSRTNNREALDNFLKALEGDPADPDYQFNVGYALFKTGDLDKAADRFRAVLERRPDDVEATTMLGRCLRQTGAARAANSRPGEGLERIKNTFEESAYLQLKAVLERKR